MSNQKIIISSFGVCLILSLIIALLLYFPGHRARIKWNNDLSPTTCKIVGHNIAKSTCSYECFCRQKCSTSISTDSKGRTQTSQSCRRVCQTCWRDCWKGYIQIEYTVYEPVRRNLTFTEYYNTRNSEWSARSNLESGKPIGSSYGCYFHRSDPRKVVKTKYFETAFLVVAIIFFAFAAIGLIGVLLTGAWSLIN